MNATVGTSAFAAGVSQGTKTDFSDPTGTTEPPAAAATPQPTTEEPQGLADWLASPAAQQYQGRWVLLDDDFTVVRAGESPADLLRHDDRPSPLVVYVQPPDASIAD